MLEWKVYLSSVKIIVGRIIFEFFLKFKWLKLVIFRYIFYVYSDEMVQKFIIVNLLLFNVNEVKYEDCVSILRVYERWIVEIYYKVGIFKEVLYIDNFEVLGVLVVFG